MGQCLQLFIECLNEKNGINFISIERVKKWICKKY